MKRQTSMISCSCGLILLGVASLATADTGFRNDGSGCFMNTKPPLHWSVESNVVWKTPLKSSNASPLVLGNRVFVCEEPDLLLAVDFADGHVLWAATNSYLAVTPPAEVQAEQEKQARAELLAGQVKAAEKKANEAEKATKGKPEDATLKEQAQSARQEVSKLKKELAAFHAHILPETHPVNGYSTPTPVTDGTTIGIVYGSGVVAGFTPEGQRLWGRILPVRPHNGSWGHSASARLADGLLLVHFGNTFFAFDARTGAERWTTNAPSGFGSPVITALDGKDAISTPGGDLFAVADGRKLASGLPRFPWNGPVVRDNVMYKVDEGEAAAYALKPGNPGQATRLWTAAVPKGRYYATAVLHEGLLYNVSQGGDLVVFDAQSGTMVYEHALQLGGGATVYPSPALAGGRIYVSGDNGVTVVVKPGRVYEELARNKLTPFRSSPTFVGDSLLIRTLSGLYRIQEK